MGLVVAVVALAATLIMTSLLTWRDPVFALAAGPDAVAGEPDVSAVEPDVVAAELARSRRFATGVWPVCCVLAVGFMATLDYDLVAVLYGAAGLYAVLCLATAGRPVVLIDRILFDRGPADRGPAARSRRRAPLQPGDRRRRVQGVIAVVVVLTALVAVSRLG